MTGQCFSYGFFYRPAGGPPSFRCDTAAVKGSFQVNFSAGPNNFLRRLNGPEIAVMVLTKQKNLVIINTRIESGCEENAGKAVVLWE